MVCVRYMVTEIGARDLGDQQRYNMLEVGESSGSCNNSTSLLLNETIQRGHN